MKEYKIVYGSSVLELINNVNNTLFQGFMLSGGVAVFTVYGEIRFYQAVYKPEEKETGIVYTKEKK